MNWILDAPAFAEAMADKRWLRAKNVKGTGAIREWLLQFWAGQLCRRAGSVADIRLKDRGQKTEDRKT